MKTLSLALLVALATGTAALANVPGVNLPQLDFPQPAEPVTRDCTTPGTLTTTCGPTAN
ncbi:MAG: hypothetical protein ACRCSU_10890 [Paracoccaceae bacterium]